MPETPGRTPPRTGKDTRPAQPVPDTAAAGTTDPGPPPDAEQAAAQSTAPNADYKKRLRHVKDFLDGPLFKDLQAQPVVVAESAAAIAERKRDLDHRIHVTRALLTLLAQDKTEIEAVQAAQAGQAGQKGQSNPV